MTVFRVLASLVFIGFFSTVSAFAQGADESKGWFDVNFGVAGSAQTSVTTETSIPDAGGEFQRYRVGYTSPTGASFDIGGGFMLTPVVGIGIQLTGTAHRHTADLNIRIPHPLYFNAYATDSTVTDQALDRTEGGVNFSLVGVLPTSNPNVRVRVYGGPTYFRLEADTVRNIRYYQEYGFFTTANSVDIISWDGDTVEETTWGFHAGLDAGLFFNRHVGIGGFARFSRGAVTFESGDFMLNDDLDVKVGGFQAGAGLRVRF